MAQISCYNTISTASMNIVLGIHLIQRFAMAGCWFKTLLSYLKVILKYKDFGYYCHINPWLDGNGWIEQWASTSIMSFWIDKQGQLVHKTLLFYFPSIWVDYIDQRTLLQMLTKLIQSFLIYGGKLFLSNTKAVSLLINCKLSSREFNMNWPMTRNWTLMWNSK